MTVMEKNVLGCGYDVFGLYADKDSLFSEMFDLTADDVEARTDAKLDEQTVTMSSTQEYQKQLSVSVGLEGTNGMFKGAVSTAFHGDKSSTKEQYYQIHTLKKKCIIYSIRPSVKLRDRLRPEVAAALDGTMAPDEFFHTYCSHYLASVVLGGKATFTCRSDRSAHTSKDSFEATASARYGVIAGSATTTRDESVRQFLAQNHAELHVIGGSVAATLENWNATTQQDWLRSVDAYPEMIDFTGKGALVPIWTLCSDAARRAAFAAAFELHAGGMDSLHDPALALVHATLLQPAASDAGLTEVKETLTTFRPEVPEGYFYVGQSLTTDARRAPIPAATMILLRDLTPYAGQKPALTEKTAHDPKHLATAPALAPPIQWECIWTTRKSDAYDHVYSCWRPVAPPGYVALGDFFQRVVRRGMTDSPPDGSYVRCVRRDLTVRAGLGERLWSDTGARVEPDISVFNVRRHNDDAIATHTFRALPQKRDVPPPEIASDDVRCLRRDRVLLLPNARIKR